MLTKSLYCGLVLAILSPLFGCGGVRYSPATIAPVTVPAEYESDRRAAVLRALAARRYATESEDGTVIMARWSKGSRFYRVAVDYSGEISMQYVDSEVEPNGPTQPGMAPHGYVGYLRNLRSSIESELGRPSRDATEASADAAEAAAAAAAAAQHMEQRRLAEEARRQRTVLVTSGASADQIRAAIQCALTARSYSIENEQESVITARWSRDDRFYRLSITYTARRIDLQYLDSDHLDDDEEDGIQIIDEKYIDYMRRLVGSVGESVNSSEPGTCD